MTSTPISSLRPARAGWRSARAKAWPASPSSPTGWRCRPPAVAGCAPVCWSARGWPAWGYDPDAPVAGTRLVCVGDAAGIDGLTGEGIAVGLAHGPLAARAIAAALASGDFAFGDYRRSLRRATVGRELALD